MIFEHDFFDLPEEDISVGTSPDGVRYYDTPAGRFPSVTTVIAAAKGTEFLERWRRRVGDTEANKVQGFSRVRGRAVHDLAERYLRNDPEWDAGVMPSNLDSFLTIKPALDASVGKVYGIEAPLWSRLLRTAGRTDLLCDWDGVPSVVDFKTSAKIKKEEHIWGYFVQKSCYSMMIQERIGVVLPQIVTVMMVDHEPPMILRKRRSDYISEVLRVFVDVPRVGAISDEALNR